MNLLPVAFAAVAGVALVGVDYVNQSNKNDVSLGTMTPGAYVATIGGRFAQAKAEATEAKAQAERQAQPAKTHLPAAPEGWVRREMSMEDFKRFNPQQMGMGGMEQELMAEVAKDPSLMGGIPSVNKVLDRKRKNTWVYENGEQAILATAYWNPVEKKKAGFAGFQQSAMQMAAHNMGMFTSTREGFAWVQGVTFYETKGMMGFDPKAEDPGYRAFEGKIGAQVKLSIRADAEEADVRALIDAINFDGLNAMLDEPLPGIGSHIAPETVERQLALTNQQAQQQRKADARKSREMEQDLIARAERISKPFGGAAGLNSDAPVQDAHAAAPAAPLPTAVAQAKDPAKKAWFSWGKSDKKDEPVMPKRLVLSGGSGCSGVNFCKVSD